MDSELRFEKHVVEVVKACFYRLKVLYKVRRFLSVDMRVRLCESLVLSKINYGLLVYGPCVYKRTEKLIQRVQNACARYCFKIPPRTHVTPYFNSADMLKLRARQDLYFSTLLFGVIKTGKPEYLFEKLTWRFSRHHTNRNNTCVLSVPRHGTAAFRGGFRYLATKCWNNIPPPLRELKTKTIFKRRIRAQLLEQQKQST